MSNVVPNKLFGYPVGTPSFQNDADTTDLNKPQDDDRIRVSAAVTGLAPDLRRIVSEFKNNTLDPVWINYLGTQYVTGAGQVQVPDPDPPVYAATHQFTLKNTNGDWGNLIRNGMRVRVTYNDGSPRAASTVVLVDTTTDGGTKTLVGVQDAVITPQLAYVEFSALGSAIGTGEPLNADTLQLEQVSTGPDPSDVAFVVPITQGGTGNTTGEITPSGAAGGDLTGTYPSPTIAKLQGTVLDLASATDGNILQLLAGQWGASPGAPSNGDFLQFGVSGWAPVTYSPPAYPGLAATLALPGYAKIQTLAGELIVQWVEVSGTITGSGGTDSQTTAFPIEFPNTVFVAIPYVAAASGLGQVAVTSIGYSGGGGFADITFDSINNVSGGGPIGYIVRAIIVGF